MARCCSDEYRCLMEGSGYPIVSLRGELSHDELIQPLRIWINPARLFPFLPCVEIGRIAHHDYADTMAAPDVTRLVERQLDRFFLVVGDMEDHIGVCGASQMRECFVDGRHVDGIERLNLEGHDLHVLAGQVAVGPDRSADKIWPRPPAARTLAPLGRGDLDS